MIDLDVMLTRVARKVILKNRIRFEIVQMDNNSFLGTVFFTIIFLDKSSNETTSDSDDGRHA